MVKIIIYAVIAIVLISLILALINKSQSILGGKEGGKDIYLRKGLASDFCNQVFADSMNACNGDKACLENSAKDWNNCINNIQTQ